MLDAVNRVCGICGTYLHTHVVSLILLYCVLRQRIVVSVHWTAVDALQFVETVTCTVVKYNCLVAIKLYVAGAHVYALFHVITFLDKTLCTASYTLLG